MTTMYLAYGDIWQGDAVNLQEGSGVSWIPADGDVQHEDAGGVKFSVYLGGTTWDDVLRNYARVENMLRRAANPYGSGVTLIECPEDGGEWTYWDVMAGSKIQPVKMSNVAPAARLLVRGNVQLTCRPFGRSSPIVTAVGGSLTNGGTTGLLLQGTPGTAEGLLELRLTGTFARVHVGQRTAMRLVDADHPRSQAFAGSITTSNAWQRLAAATVTGKGRYDVLASVTDAGLVLTSPRITRCENSTAAGSLPAGSTFTYVVTPYDSLNRYGPPSRYATVTTPEATTSDTETPLKYIAYDDLESGEITQLMPGPLGDGVTVTPAAAYGGSGYGLRIPATAIVAEAAPDWPDSKTLSWQAEIRPYQAGFGIGVRFNHGGSGNTTTTTTHTEQSGTQESEQTGTSENTSEQTSDTLPGTYSRSTTNGESHTYGSSENTTDSDGWSNNSTPYSHSYSATRTTGGAGASSTNTTVTTTNWSESTSGSDNTTTTDSDGTRGETQAGTTQTNGIPSSIYFDNDITRTISSGSTWGQSTNIATTTNPDTETGAGNNTETTTDGNSSNRTETQSHSHSVTNTPRNDSYNRGWSQTDNLGHSHTQNASSGTSGSTSEGSNSSISDSSTTTTTIQDNNVNEQFGLYVDGGNCYAARIDYADNIVLQLTDPLAIDANAFHLAELTALKTQSGVAFRVSIDRHVMLGWEEVGATVVDFCLSGVDADNIAFASQQIGGAVIAGGSEDFIDWDPSINASGYLLSWQQDQLPWRSLDVGAVYTYTHTTPTPALSTVQDPPSGALAVDYARLRVSLGGGSTETRLLPQPIVRTAIAGGKAELVHLGRFTFPPGPACEGGAEANQTRLVLEGQMGGTVADTLSTAQLWYFPADEPESGAGVVATCPGLAGASYEWRLGTDRWGKSYARLYSGGSYAGSADVSGALGAGPGDTLLTVALEKENADGTYSPDLALTYTMAAQRVPRWRSWASPGGGF